MPRPTKKPEAEASVEPKKIQTEEERMAAMPLTSLPEYIRYNREARALNKRYRTCKYPIKQCPVELHPTERIVFGRNDQPANPLQVFLSNEYIEYKETLYPGKTYDIPRVVAEYLAEKGTPEWKKFTNPDGTVETRISHYNPRFALRTVYS